jgi:hypothetical protein
MVIEPSEKDLFGRELKEIFKSFAFFKKTIQLPMIDQVDF